MNGPTPQQRAALDQAMALLADTFPPMLARYYASLKEAGLPESAALLLTIEAQKVILLSLFAPRPPEQS